MNIVQEKNGRVASITLNRPPLNVLNLATLRELRVALDAIANDSSIDVLLLRGSTRAFSAGVDVKDHTRDKVPEMLETVHGVIRNLFALPQITIAVVQGACLGGGCELATSCDLLVAAEESFFATPEITVGCYPPVALARFPNHVGYHRAVEMILTARKLTAQEALAIGLVNRVVPATELEAATQCLLDELLSKSGKVLRITLKGLREVALETFSEALTRSEEIYLKELLATEDVEEGVQAFLQKRKPEWKHR